MRIVSLLPSSTEILCALGLEDQLVGVTHECDFPASVRALPKVTRSSIPAEASSGEIDRLVREQLSLGLGLYSLDLPTLERLEPELIITQALCDVCAVSEDEVRAIASRLPGPPRVVSLEPTTLSQVFEGIRLIGTEANAERAAAELLAALSTRVEAVVARSARLDRRPRVALLEWLDPPFSSGHWSPELVRMAGGVEGLGREGHRSRTLEWTEVTAWDPKVVFIACCGQSLEQSLADIAAVSGVDGWRDWTAVRSGRVYLTDGSQYFNRPGPRLVDSLEILAHALHPDLHPLPSGLPPATSLARIQEPAAPDGR